MCGSGRGQGQRGAVDGHEAPRPLSGERGSEMAPTGSQQREGEHASSAASSGNQQPDVCVRSYEPRDFKAVRELFAEGMRMYCAKDCGENEGLRGYINRSLQGDMADIEGTYFATGRSHFWVATIDETVAGMIAFRGGDDGKGELCRLSVKTEFRRHGLAHRLVAQVETWAKANGFSAVTLRTNGNMVPALRLYESLGYACTYARPNSDPARVLYFMEKDLALVA